MPKSRENIIHLYWDKALLLILAVLGIYVFLTRVISSPIKTDDGSAGSITPQTIRDSPASMIASVQGGVRP